jgi:hypothetical protein
MERLYYAEDKCTTVPRVFPLVCYHCGSGDGVSAPKTDKEWTQVYPQCAKCQADNGTQVEHSGRVKQCDAATTSKKRKAEEAALLAADRAKKRKKAPNENSGEDGIKGLVGRRKQGGLKFVQWKHKDTGEDYPKDQCTWEPKTFGCEVINLTM